MDRRSEPYRVFTLRPALLCLAGALLLGGCAQLQGLAGGAKTPPADDREQATAAEPEPPPEPACPELPVEELETEAMVLLDGGQVEEARFQLECALGREPGARRARLLMEQLDADPMAYLGEQSFQYTVQPGQSLSRLARRFLDDPLKFVILARYNDIAVPADLQAGQRIRIPGEAPPPPPPEPEQPDAAELLERARAAEAAGELERALELAGRAAEAEQAPERAAAVRDRIQSVLLRRYADQAYQAEAQDDLERALALWQDVLALDPENFEAQLNLNRLQDQTR